MGLHRAFTSLIPSSWLYYLIINMYLSELKHCFWIYSFIHSLLKDLKVRSKEVKQDFLKVPWTDTQAMSFRWGPQLGLRAAMESSRVPLSPLPTCSFYISSASPVRIHHWGWSGQKRDSVGLQKGRPHWEPGEFYFQPLHLHKRGSDSQLDLSRMWSSEDARLLSLSDTIPSHCLSAPPPGLGVHLFMETARSRLGIFRQSLCWALLVSTIQLLFFMCLL